MPAEAAIGGAELDELYRPPHPLVLTKQQDAIDEHSARFVRASSLVILATTSEAGTDASPRGGPPGFVAVLDAGHLAFGDLSGNNRIDSYRNLVEHPEVGMLFLVPGMEETLRVNGRASLTTDPEILEATTIDGRTPKVAVVVEVAEAFVHCAKALRRSGVWDPSTWGAADGDDAPSPSAALTAHLELEVEPEVVGADLELAYQETLWDPGGA